MTFQQVEQIKSRHESELMAIDGVQGVGIGDSDGRPAIKVYVDVDDGARSSRIPRRLEDVPVVIEESGIFEAY